MLPTPLAGGRPPTVGEPEYQSPPDPAADLTCTLGNGADDIIFVEHLDGDVTELAHLSGDGRRRSRPDHHRRRRGGVLRDEGHSSRGGGSGGGGGNAGDRRRDRGRFHSRGAARGFDNARVSAERCVTEERPTSPNPAFRDVPSIRPVEELQPPLPLPQQQQQQQPPASQWNVMFPMMGNPNMPNQPNMMAMPPHNFNQFGFMAPSDMRVPIMAGPPKEIIQCKSCTLFPPNPNGPPPTTRDRPPGCRTAFVGGLPENITEEIIREIFDRFGESSTIRMSKKNFCHIRYENECFVDYAICLSGYRVRIKGSTEPPNTGRLHVDYAQARDDLYEWECRQRQMQREYRHRERIEQERLRPPSPPSTRVVHYSEHEAIIVGDWLKTAVHSAGSNGTSVGGAIPSQNDVAAAEMGASVLPPSGEELFKKAVQTLIVWLERGDCSKRNAGNFYSMIQSTNGQVRRLINDKSLFEAEMQAAKDKLRQRINAILIQFNQIEKVFGAASHQKVWDHFTKAQRKNIDAWKKSIQEFRRSQMDDVLGERMGDEMDFSDEDDNEASNSKQMRFDYGAGDDERVCELSSQLHNLKEDNDSLRCQLEAYKNEVDLIKSDGRVQLDEQGQQAKALQQQLIVLNQQRLKDEETIKTLRKRLSCPDEEVAVAPINVPILESQIPAPLTQSRMTEQDAKLIGLVSTFLHVHPFGASVDYIWSYLHCMDSALKPSDVEALLLKFPTVFKQEMSGVGATLERKWIFTGFMTSPTAT